MIIGITGGTGSGKSTLLQLIANYGGSIFDCDRIYHALLQKDTHILTAIERHFPGVVSNGILDRKQLGKIVFHDRKALSDLNYITHSAVKAEVQKQIQNTKPALAAIDAIGLFEGDLASICDVTVAVIAPLEIRVNRIMARDGISEDYARSRITSQQSDEWFSQKCDYVLENDGCMEDFTAKCLAFLHKYDII